MLGRLANEYALTLEETVERYVGVLEHALNTTSVELRNPISLLREGVQCLVLTPLHLLTWVRIMGVSAARQLRHSVAVRLFSGMITVLTVVSALVSLVTGWERFVELAEHAVRNVASSVGL